MTRFSSVWLGAFLLGLIAATLSYAQEARVPQEGPAESKGPRKRALLIGVNDYAFLNDLDFCGRDIQSLREGLTATGVAEEDVILMRDGAEESRFQPFKTNIERELDTILSSVNPGDLILVTFSGHGVHLDGASYLCPIEAQLDELQDTLVSLERIYTRLAACEAGQKLLIVDACRNDPRPGGQKSISKPTDDLNAFARSLENPPEGILVFTSCSPEQVSIEDPDFRHGVFMHYVLMGLQGEADRGNAGNNDRRVSLLELYGYARLMTTTYVARTRNLIQTPMLRGKVVGDYEIAAALPRRPEKLPSRFFRSSHKDLDTILGEDPEVIVAADPNAQLALRQACDLLLANGTSALSDGIAKADCDKALAACNEAIRLESQNPFAYLLRGVAYRKRGDYAEALADCERVDLPLRAAVGYYSIDGMELKTDGEVTGTVALGDRLTIAEVRGDDLRITAAIPLGRVGGRADEKSGWIDKIVLQPELKEVQDERKTAGRNVRTQTVSRRRVDPSDRLGTITAEDPEALEALQRAHDILADDLALDYAVLRKNLTDEEVDAAITTCNEAIEIEPENRSALRLRAMAYRWKREFDRALADLKMLEQPLELRVTSRTANLMGGSEVNATVAYGDMLSVSDKNGDWLWVKSVRGHNDKEGWIEVEHVARRDLLTSRTFERASRATGQSYGSATPIRDTVIERAINVGRGYIPYGGFLPF